MEIVPFPATYCGDNGERLRCAAHKGEACRGVGDSGKTVGCRGLPTGANRKVAAATIAAAHCAAMWCVSRRGGIVVAAGANFRFKAMPRYHNNLRRGRRPRRPLFGLPPHFASNHCTLLCGCVGCLRLPPRFARRDTQLLAARNSAGAVRQTTVKSGWHPSALADRCLLLDLIGGTFTNSRGETSNATAGQREPALKSGFFGYFLAAARK
jgi:hypothetical protein